MQDSWMTDLKAEKDLRIAVVTGVPGRKKALLTALLMLLASIPVYLLVTDFEKEPAESGKDKLTDWQVHFTNAASDLPECTENRIGWLYYVSADQNFQGCTSSGWELIDVTEPAGADGTNGVDGQDGVNGTNGTDGQDGQDGTNGADGQDGVDGTDGVSTLINAVTSTSCLNGGTTFEIGSDDNADGLLSVTEVKVTVDICNGAQGPAGADGTNGTDGADGADGQNGADGLNALVSTTTEAAGSNCANGGIRIDVGVDDDNDGTNGYELWKSDGTSSGTMMVKDINSGIGNSDPNYITAVGSTLYFVANGGTYREELSTNRGVFTEVTYS